MGDRQGIEGITTELRAAKMDKKNIGIGLIGLGVVAGQVARVLTDKADELAEKAGCRLNLRKVKVLPQDLSRPQAKKMPSRLFTTDDDEFFLEPGIDIVVEAIGGERPAFDYIKRAIEGGKHVVTSNKEVIAKHGMELLELAWQHGVGLQYEASVGGGIPLIAPFKHDLVANNISAIFAIINGTTNWLC
jgi:homoserine dehydrogenase